MVALVCVNYRSLAFTSSCDSLRHNIQLTTTLKFSTNYVECLCLATVVLTRGGQYLEHNLPTTF